MMRTLLLVVVLSVVAVPALAVEEGHGSAAEHHSETFLGLPTSLWKTVNMLGFFALLGWLLAKPLSRFFHARREAIGRELTEAETQRQDAAALRAQTDAKLAALSSEIAALRERLQREGEREREALVQAGQAEAARLLAQVEAEATRRVDAARATLARDAATAAAAIAWELLERELTPADRERIFRQTLERLRSDTAVGVQ